ncbi:MAG: sigma-70 family RNA polymerase sigma factor [Acidobacteriota bacterium]
MSPGDALLKKDFDSFSRLYDEYAQVVFSLAIRILRSREDAENVVQDVFLSAWQQSHTFDAQRGNLRTWLLAIARNRSIDHLRARGSRREDEQTGFEDWKESGGLSPSDRLIDSERSARIRRALAALGEDQRRALELSYYQGLSHREIAEKLHEPLGTVKTRINLGLKKLREALKEYSGRQIHE